jgi:hypothetical protein
VKSRKLPGVIALGLLVSLLAHAAVYGGSHALGGSYDDLFQGLALAGVIGFVALVAQLAWAGRECCMGSVLASRLASVLPPLLPLAIAGGAWFAFGELIEGRHASAAVWIIALAVIAAAALVRYLAGLSIRAIAAIAIAGLERLFAPRLPQFVRLFEEPVRAHDDAHLAQRFARPPPALISSPL